MRLAFEIIGAWIALDIVLVAWLGWVNRERREDRRRIVHDIFDGRRV